MEPKPIPAQRSCRVWRRRNGAQWSEGKAVESGGFRVVRRETLPSCRLSRQFSVAERSEMEPEPVPAQRSSRVWQRRLERSGSAGKAGESGADQVPGRQCASFQHGTQWRGSFRTGTTGPGDESWQTGGRPGLRRQALPSCSHFWRGVWSGGPELKGTCQSATGGEL